MEFEEADIIQTIIKCQHAVTEEWAAQMETEQYTCDEYDYDAEYLNKLKRHQLSQHDGVKGSCKQCWW